jgi:beta-galactosidase
MTVLGQMYAALCALNIEPDFVRAGDGNLERYKVLLVPPLYSASNEVLRHISEYVRNGGHVVMAFKSGFTNEFSTVRDTMAPGPLEQAAGFHYQEFTNLPKPQKLTPDRYKTGNENAGSVWQEFLILDTAEVIESLDDPYWHYPSITRNRYARGTLTYQATYVSDSLQREILRDVLTLAGLTGPDQSLPPEIKVRHGRNSKGKTLHYYLNFSGTDHTVSYPYQDGTDLLSAQTVKNGSPLKLKAWDLVIVAEQ